MSDMLFEFLPFKGISSIVAAAVSSVAYGTAMPNFDSNFDIAAEGVDIIGDSLNG